MTDVERRHYRTGEIAPALMGRPVCWRCGCTVVTWWPGGWREGAVWACANGRCRLAKQQSA